MCALTREMKAAAALQRTHVATFDDRESKDEMKKKMKRL